MTPSPLPPMPAVNPPRPLAPGNPFLESDIQWVENNMAAVVWLLSNAEAIRAQLDASVTLQTELAKAHQTMSGFYTDMENALDGYRIAANPVAYDIKVLVGQSSTHLQTIGRLREALQYFVTVCESAPPIEFVQSIGEANKRAIAALEFAPQSPDLRAKLAETVAMYEGKAEQSRYHRDAFDHHTTEEGRELRARHQRDFDAYRSVAQHLKSLLS